VVSGSCMREAEMSGIGTEIGGFRNHHDSTSKPSSWI